MNEEANIPIWSYG